MKKWRLCRECRGKDIVSSTIGPRLEDAGVQIIKHEVIYVHRRLIVHASGAVSLPGDIIAGGKIELLEVVEVLGDCKRSEQFLLQKSYHVEHIFSLSRSVCPDIFEYSATFTWTPNNHPQLVSKRFGDSFKSITS